MLVGKLTVQRFVAHKSRRLQIKKVTSFGIFTTWTET